MIKITEEEALGESRIEISDRYYRVCFTLNKENTLTYCRIHPSNSNGYIEIDLKNFYKSFEEAKNKIKGIWNNGIDENRINPVYYRTLAYISEREIL